MKRCFIVILSAVLLGPFLCIAEANASGQRVILISVDGLRPAFYLDDSWPAPVLQRLAREGASASAVTPVFPPVTYPNHASLVTGVRPAVHGIYYNKPFSEAGLDSSWYWSADAFKVETLWDRVAQTGGQVAAVGWPSTVNADIAFNIPEVWTAGEFSDFIRPVRQAATPELLETIEQQATGLWTDPRIANDYPQRDWVFAQAAAWLLDHHRPELLMWHPIALDHAQHDEGLDGPAVRESLAAVDSGVGLLLSQLEKSGLRESTTVVITGDHGMLPRKQQMAPNVLLKDAGLLDDPGMLEDWSAVFLVSGAAFLHIQNPDERETIDKVRILLKSLPASERARFEIVEKSRLREWGAAPEAVLALVPRPGTSFTDSVKAELWQPAQGATHVFDPQLPGMQTGLIIWGPRTDAGISLGQRTLIDVAPTVACLLDVSLPMAKGKVIESVCQPGE